MEKVSEPEEGGGAGEAGEAGAPAGVCVMISLLYVRSCHERGKVCSDRAWTYRRTACSVVPPGGVRRCRGSDVSWVGRSLGRGALATYGDPVGTGGHEGRWMENGEQKLLEGSSALNAGVSRCAEGQLSLTDVCNTVLTSSHWCPSLSTVASAPIFTQTHNYETELSAPSLLRTSKAEAWAGVWSPTPAPPPASPLDSPLPAPPPQVPHLCSRLVFFNSVLEWPPPSGSRGIFWNIAGIFWNKA